MLRYELHYWAVHVKHRNEVMMKKDCIEKREISADA